MTSRACVFTACLTTLVGACGPADYGPDAARADAPPPDASPSCLEAVQHQDLAWIEENVFRTGCAGFNSCHKGSALEAGGINLEVGNAHAELVGVSPDFVTSGLFDTYKLVVPGSPADSYLMIILGQYTGPIDEDVGTMPFNNDLLCQEKRDAIERWISAGANP